jgi:hypothetical protein
MGPANSSTRITLQAAHCAITFSRPASRVVLMEIDGLDLGELERTPFVLLDDLLERAGPLELFVDARKARGPSLDVSAQWARWLARNRRLLERVTMLTGPRGHVKVTAEFVRRFSELGERMRVVTESHAFDAALSVASLC